MQVVFNKKFLSPSSDLIAIFAGLESIDQVFFDFLDHLSLIIKQKHSKDEPHFSYILSVQVNSIRTATIAAGGAYQTSLASYFTNRDIFSSIMSFIDMEGTEQYVGDAFTLIGILASYDKLEAVNPYRTRLADFVDRHSMIKSIQASGHVWEVCFEKYASTFSEVRTGRKGQTNVGQSMYNSVAYWMGMGSTGSTDMVEVDSLPLEIISLTLATYEFINSNKVYARLLLECPESSVEALVSPNPPFANFLSLCTYLFQNQHKNQRAALYSRLNLLILRLLVEAPSSSLVTSLLLSDERRTKCIHVCQQRSPKIPNEGDSNGRLLIEGLLDAVLCAIRYNMKRGLDLDMYILAFTILFQSIHLLRSSKVGLNYHWSELWKSIFSLIKFINSHPPGVSNGSESIPESTDSNDFITLGRLITLVLASALIHGDVIFAEPSQYDDLLYKLMESSQSFEKFGALFPSLIASPSMSVLKAAINHYSTLFNSSSDAKIKPSFFSLKSQEPATITTMGDLTPQKVGEILRQGYQTLSLHQYVTKGNNNAPSLSGSDQSQASFLLYDQLPQFNENEERLFLKRMSKQVIADVQQLHSKLQ